MIDLEMLVIADFLLFVYLSLESTTTKTTPTPIPNPERPIHHDHTTLRHDDDDDELNALLRWFSFIIHHQGGGIYVTGTSTVTMTECTISDNTAVSSPSLRPAACEYILITVVVDRS